MSRHPSRTVAFNMKQRPKLLFPYHPTCFFSLHIHNTSLWAPGWVGSSRVRPVLTLLIGPSHLRVTGGHFSFWRIHPAPCSTVNKTNKQTSLSELVEYSLVMGEVRSRVLILPSYLPSTHLWRQFQTLTIEILNKMPLIQIWKQTTLPCVRVMYYWLSTVSTCVFRSTFFLLKSKKTP